ncbi:MAG: hypothetical protein QXD03_04000 [Candidatus Anstonellales archaeon]
MSLQDILTKHNRLDLKAFVDVVISKKLCNNSIVNRIINEVNTVQSYSDDVVLVIDLMKAIYIKCGDVFEDNIIEKIYKSCRYKHYRVKTLNGERIATINEIEEGVEELEYTEEMLISSEDYRFVVLWMWIKTGNIKYYKELGLKEANTFVEMSLNVYQDILKAIEWYRGNRVKEVYKVINKTKYKYPLYAIDEIKPDIPFKQLIYNLDNKLPRKSSNPEIRKALYLVIAYNKENKVDMLPEDKAFLRRIYKNIDRYINNGVEVYEDKVLIDLCNYIEEGCNQGYINKNHFAFKIIETFKAKGYKKCSKKQLDILNEAKGIIDKNKKMNVEETHDNEIVSIYGIDINDIFLD